MRIDMSKGSWEAKEAPARYHLLGGRALTSTMVFEEVPASAEPLGRRTKVIIAPGLLGGIPVSSIHRLSVGAKSPLTGGIKESNSGGDRKSVV
jgi:aldehyde:ferredoxin oxidoreductase